MNRRSFFSFLGVAPAAVFAKPAAPTPPAPTVPPVGYIVEQFSHYEALPDNWQIANCPQQAYRAVAMIKHMIYSGTKWVELDSDEGREIQRCLKSPDAA